MFHAVLLDFYYFYWCFVKLQFKNLSYKCLFGPTTSLVFHEINLSLAAFLINPKEGKTDG